MQRVCFQVDGQIALGHDQKVHAAWYKVKQHTCVRVSQHVTSEAQQARRQQLRAGQVSEPSSSQHPRTRLCAAFSSSDDPPAS